MKKITALFFLGVSIILGVYGLSYGVSSYATSFKSTYPSSPLSSLSTVSGQAGNLCTVCHGASGGTRNAYGSAYAGAGHVYSTIQNTDSDGDTFSNITEINAGTFPGNAASKPATADVTAPTVSLSAPANGSTFTTAQTVAINATAADAVGVTKVEFYDGATLLGTDLTLPYSFTWAITSAGNGAHSFTAKAYDAAANVGTSAAVGVTVTIATADVTAPTVSLSAPANGSTFTTAQTVAINATAADAVGVTRVEFYDGATLLGTDLTSPYSFAWAITSAGNGAHSFTAKAYDAAANVRTSAAVGVTVTIATTLNGAALYSTNCEGCHNPLALSSKLGRTANQIQTAINTDAGGMGFLSTLTSAEISAIAAALAPPADTTAPTVSISAPANGSTFTTAQTVAINATAADAVGVTKVEFYDGATLLGTDLTSPYSFAWAITSASNGAHSFTAKAYDAAANVRTSAAVGVTVTIATATPPSSSSDKQAPTISSFKLPKKSSSLTVTISSFKAKDNVGVKGYRVSESSKFEGNDWSSTPPSNYTFKSQGSKVLYAQVRDEAGNISKSKSAKIKITLPADDDDEGDVQSSSNSSSSTKAVQRVVAYDPIFKPVISSDLLKAKPVAVGAIAEDGNMLRLEVGLGNLQFPVDAYLTLYSPSESGEPVHAYTLNAENEFKPLVDAKQIWRSGVNALQEVISETPAIELIPGKYMIVFEIKMQDSTDLYHSWMTSFTIQ